MKFPIIIIILLITTVSVSSQTRMISENSNLYYKALKVYLEENEKEYSKLFSDRDFNKVVIIKDDFIPKNLPDSIGKYAIEYVDFDELKQRLNYENDKMLLVAGFQPYKKSGNKFTINIAEYQAKLQRNRLSLGLSDGITITFKFDSETKMLILEKFEFFGI